jgi:hypothetical protein
MDPVIVILQKFKREQDRIKASSNENSAVDAKVILLEEKIRHLDTTLGRVASLGKDMRAALRKNKDPADILDKFAGELIALASGASKSEQSNWISDFAFSLSFHHPTDSYSVLVSYSNFISVFCQIYQGVGIVG